MIYVNIIIVIILVGAIATAIWEEIKINKRTISFRETMDLTGLPIITFKCNGQKYNFLLDTGAMDSYLNADLKDEMQAIPTDYCTVTSGYNGEKEEMRAHIVNLEYKEEKLSTMMFLSGSIKFGFQVTKEMSGVQLHGILGSDFFAKYKYVIDFENLIAYSTKKSME